MSLWNEAFHFVHRSKSVSENQKISAEENNVNIKKIPKNKSSDNVLTLKTDKSKIKRGTSFVVGQKLRESKWFSHDEIKVLCAVIESGFIVEKDEGGITVFGIALWQPGFGKLYFIQPYKYFICPLIIFSREK